MPLAIGLTVLAIAGIVLGVARKNKALAIGSSIALVAVVLVWASFWTNPY